MNIKEISEIKVVDTIENTGETPRILLEIQGSIKKIEVFGKCLEAQYRVGDNFLFMVTEGNPFEEALYIYYYDNCLELLDSLELSAIYAEGVLGNISVSANSNEILFSFFDNEERWVLNVYAMPRFTAFNARHPVKRKSSVFHKNWLSLKKV